MTYTFESFKDYFFAYLSSTISYQDITVDNIDFCEAVCFDCYRIYEQSGVNVNVICKLAENMLYSVKRYQPIFTL